MSAKFGPGGTISGRELGLAKGLKKPSAVNKSGNDEITLPFATE
jgi:hypothetical protein